MSNHEDNLKSLLQDKLADVEFPVSNELLPRIKKAIIRKKILKIAGASALIGILLITSFVLFSTENNNNISQHSNRNQVVKTTTNQTNTNPQSGKADLVTLEQKSNVEIPSKFNDNNSITNTISKDNGDLNNKNNVSVNNNLDVKKQSNQSESGNNAVKNTEIGSSINSENKITQKEGINSGNNIKNATGKDLPNNFNSQVSSKSVETEKTKNEIGLLDSTTLYNSRLDTKSIDSLDKTKTGNFEINKTEAIKPPEVNNSVSTKNDTIKSKSSVGNGDVSLTVDSLLSQNANIVDSAKVDTTLIAAKNQGTDTENTSAKNKIIRPFIGVEVGAFLPFITTTIGLNNKMGSTSAISNKQGFSTVGALYGGVKIKNKFRLSTGISLSQFNVKYSTPQTLDTVVNMVNYHVEYVLYTRIKCQFVNIPTQLEYGFNIGKKIAITPSAGIVFNYLSKASITSSISALSGESVNDERSNFNTWSNALLGGLKIEYLFTDRWTTYFSSTYSLFRGNLYKRDTDYKIAPSFLNMNMGARYYF